MKFHTDNSRGQGGEGREPRRPTQGLTPEGCMGATCPDSPGPQASMCECVGATDMHHRTTQQGARLCLAGTVPPQGIGLCLPSHRGKGKWVQGHHDKYCYNRKSEMISRSHLLLPGHKEHTTLTSITGSVQLHSIHFSGPLTGQVTAGSSVLRAVLSPALAPWPVPTPRPRVGRQGRKAHETTPSALDWERPHPGLSLLIRHCSPRLVFMI